MSGDVRRYIMFNLMYNFGSANWTGLFGPIERASGEHQWSPGELQVSGSADLIPRYRQKKRNMATI